MNLFALKNRMKSVLEKGWTDVIYINNILYINNVLFHHITSYLRDVCVILAKSNQMFVGWLKFCGIWLQPAINKMLTKDCIIQVGVLQIDILSVWCRTEVVFYSLLKLLNRLVVRFGLCASINWFSFKSNIVCGIAPAATTSFKIRDDLLKPANNCHCLMEILTTMFFFKEYTSLLAFTI